MSLNPLDVDQASDKYNVVVRQQLFCLSRAQITFDSPNLFTLSFLGDFSEATSRTLELDSNPDLFAIIVDYLSGYPVLPLDASMVPNRMSIEAAMRYLAKDADYLGLTRLQGLLTTPRGAFQKWAGAMTYGVDLVDVLSDKLPSFVQWAAEPPRLVDVRESNKQVYVMAQNVGLRFVRHKDWMHPPQVGQGTSISRDMFWITHLEGSEDLPLIYGNPDPNATVTLDGYGCIFVNDFKSYYGVQAPMYLRDLRNSYTPTDRASKHYYDLVTSPEREKIIWASHAVFSVHGRDVLDQATQWRHWDVRLISARGKTKSMAIEHALFSGEP